MSVDMPLIAQETAQSTKDPRDLRLSQFAARDKLCAMQK